MNHNILLCFFVDFKNYEDGLLAPFCFLHHFQDSINEIQLKKSRKKKFDVEIKYIETASGFYK